MGTSESLSGLREEIDRLDDQIVDLLGERFALVREVAAIKHARGIPAVIPERIAEVIERCVDRGGRQDLDARMLRDLYSRIIEEACRLEERAMAKAPRRPAAASGGGDG